MRGGDVLTVYSRDKVLGPGKSGDACLCWNRQDSPKNDGNQTHGNQKEWLSMTDLHISRGRFPEVEAINAVRPLADHSADALHLHAINLV